jgi:hypothetical protein
VKKHVKKRELDESLLCAPLVTPWCVFVLEKEEEPALIVGRGTIADLQCKWREEPLLV